MNLYRSRDNSLIAGICGGLAQYLGWSPFRLRVIWVLALWFLMPKAPASFEPAVLQPWKKVS